MPSLLMFHGKNSVEGDPRCWEMVKFHPSESFLGGELYIMFGINISQTA